MQCFIKIIITLHFSVFIKLQFTIILRLRGKETRFRTLINVVEYTVPVSVKSISCPYTVGQKTCLKSARDEHLSQPLIFKRGGNGPRSQQRLDLQEFCTFYTSLHLLSSL